MRKIACAACSCTCDFFVVLVSDGSALQREHTPIESHPNDETGVICELQSVQS